MSDITRPPDGGTHHEPAGAAMWQHISDLPTAFQTGGRTYRVAIEGLERPDGTWAGRVTFSGAEGVRKTDQETSQPDRKALEYWATGLEKVYLEGAFVRSR